MESKGHHEDTKMSDTTREALYHTPSAEPGFTGAPENWFDGKISIKILKFYRLGIREVDECSFS